MNDKRLICPRPRFIDPVRLPEPSEPARRCIVCQRMKPANAFPKTGQGRPELSMNTDGTPRRSRTCEKCANKETR